MPSEKETQPGKVMKDLLRPLCQDSHSDQDFSFSLMSSLHVGQILLLCSGFKQEYMVKLKIGNVFL